MENDLHIIYVSGLYSSGMCSLLTHINENLVKAPAQKYHKLMAEGLAAHPGVSVTAVGAVSVSRDITKKLYFKEKPTAENNVTYRQAGVFNIPLLRNIMALFGVMVQIWRLSKKQPQCVIVCDILNITMSVAALAAARLKRIKTVGIVTDVDFLYNPNAARKLAWALVRRFSAYLLLTIHMRDYLGIHGKPYVVAEGHVDIGMAQRENSLHRKYGEKICMYAGDLQEINGIKMLAEAFLAADIPDAVLLVYGTGDCEDMLKKLSQQHKNICFGGTVPNEKIVEEQLTATLLINPRPTDREIVRYSFPSKNMEYIASGTPLLTTKLPGMPNEYLPHVYLFEDETVDGYAKTLRDVLSLPVEELHAKGIAAKEFAIQNKNNITQAGKLLRMVRELCTL